MASQTPSRPGRRVVSDSGHGDNFYFHVLRAPSLVWAIFWLMRNGAPCATPWEVRDDSGRLGHVKAQENTLRHLDTNGGDITRAGEISRDLGFAVVRSALEIARDITSKVKVSTAKS